MNVEVIRDVSIIVLAVMNIVVLIVALFVILAAYLKVRGLLGSVSRAVEKVEDATSQRLTRINFKSLLAYSAALTGMGAYYFIKRKKKNSKRGQTKNNSALV